VFSGCYYVGHIDNVIPIPPESKNSQQVKTALNAVGITENKFEDMVDSALNITFKVKDVHVCFAKVFTRPLDLKGYKFDYQFHLVKLEEYPKFTKEISKYSNH